MAEIKNLQRLVEKLRARAAKAVRDSDAAVAVGYTAAYSVFVHENLEAKHPVGKAKFLEDPAKTNAPEYAGIVREALKGGKTVAQALVLAGLALQADSQDQVPVDTGVLKNSAFTRLETGGEGG